MPETGEPHASPCGHPRTEGYDAVLRELKALTHSHTYTGLAYVFIHGNLDSGNGEMREGSLEGV